jgi:hypothetical protein
MKMLIEVMVTARLHRSSITDELLAALRKRAWYLPTETVLKDHAIDHEFFIMVEEIEDIAADNEQTQEVRDHAAELYDKLPDITYLQIIDQ